MRKLSQRGWVSDEAGTNPRAVLKKMFPLPTSCTNHATFQRKPMLLTSCWVGTKKTLSKQELLVLRYNRARVLMGRLAVLGGVVRTMLSTQTDASKQVPVASAKAGKGKRRWVNSHIWKLFSVFKRSEKLVKTSKWVLSSEMTEETKEEKIRGCTWFLRAGSPADRNTGSRAHRRYVNSQFSRKKHWLSQI